MPAPTTRRHVLGNGLTVILRESHAIPVVSSWLWYRVGSRNEGSGMTGAAHWVEHMMFKGTPQYGKGQLDKLIARNGGTFNAFTNTDYTCYFETLPASKLDLALSIESDRMANAMFVPEEFEGERTVIISEREGLENYPEFLLAEELSAAAFKVHPYHHEVIGWKSDLQTMTRDQLFGLYRMHYAPNNAILAIAGDLDPDATLARIEELFGAIPAVPGIPRVDVAEPPQRGERRVKVRQAGPTVYVEMGYRAPAGTHVDAPALMVLDAVFSGAKPMSLMRPTASSRSARLYRALVEAELASDISSSFSLTADPGLFMFSATVMPERSADEVEAAITREVERLLTDGVTEEELVKGRKQTRAQLAYSIESLANQAYWLGFFELLDSYERFEHFEESIAAVTCEQVQDVARRYLVEDSRTVGHFVPTNPTTGGGAAPTPPAARMWPTACAYRSAALSSSGTAVGPETVRREVLPNGVVVMAYRNPVAPSMVVVGNLRAGAVLDPAGKRGLAAFTANMLERGTARRTFQQLNEELDSVGASLHVGAGGHTAGFIGKGLVEDADLLLDVMADVMQQPSFPQEEMRKLRGEIVADLYEMDDDTAHVASQRFRELLFPADHPYHYRVAGYVDDVSAVLQSDLEGFYRDCYNPRNLTMVVVGDVDTGQAVDAVARRFGDWHSDREPVQWHLPAVELPASPQSAYAVMADKTQADLTWGFLGLPRRHPDYYPAFIGDVIWGQLGMMGRLGEKVREELGLAYYVYSRLDAGYSAGPWSVRAGVNPRGLDRALAAITGEARRIAQEPVSANELADAKAFLTGSMPLRLETHEGLATAIMSIEEFRLGLDYIQKYPDTIGAVTAEQILAVTSTYIQPDRVTYAVAGPERAVSGSSPSEGQPG
ncbi:MAG: M16 family metallopeptidase [Anaerolineae bacterium]